MDAFLLRNSQWALDILDAWASMGPKGRVRDEAGKILTRELRDRPVFENDGQSAMVYLLVKEREKWGSKVYLESAYYLHGYWAILVDGFEGMIKNYHLGLGDHRQGRNHIQAEGGCGPTTPPPPNFFKILNNRYILKILENKLKKNYICPPQL